MTLDRFYKSKKCDKNIFYIDWTTEQPTATWLLDKPTNISFETTVNWRNLNFSVNICCFDTEKPYNIPTENTFHNTSLLKSLLQKCVRRKMLDMSLKTTWHLIKMDQNTYLRRILIIMLEDTTIHYAFSTLTWLMCAVSKGYKLTLRQIEWLLGVTKYICEENTKYYTLQNLSSISIKNLYKSINKSNILNQQKDLLFSILFRYGYGGLKCDLHMLHYYVINWFDKFVNGHELMFVPIIPIDITNIDMLNPSDILLNSADFHCFPNILNMIQMRFPQFSVEQIKSCIWDCNSKTNLRADEPISQENKEIWTIIKSTVSDLQRTLINNFK